MTAEVETDGRVALITGAASGIGRATASLLAARGWRLALTDVKGDELRTACDELRDLTPVESLAGDVRDRAHMDQLVQSAVRRFGRISALVNSAGITLPSDSLNIEAVSEEDFDRTISINLKGIFIACKAALPHLVPSKGSIVNLSSAAAVKGIASTAYPASKAGVLALSRSIAYQYAEAGVRCNAVLPGPIDTPMLDVTEQKLQQPLAHAPGTIPRKGEPGEVASLIAFLVSDESRYITGASIAIDGGLTSA